MSDVILEIHHINVCQGDATLIIVRNTEAMKNKLVSGGIFFKNSSSGEVWANSTYTAKLPPKHTWLQLAKKPPGVNLDGTVDKAILIDAGVGEFGRRILDYMSNIGVKDINYIFTSHYDHDHIGGLPIVINDLPNTLGKFAYDRSDAPVSEQLKNYTDMVIKAMNDKGAGVYGRKCVGIKTDGTLDFDSSFIDLALGNGGSYIRLKCIALNAIVINNVKTEPVKKNTNNFSMAWLLQYGAFRYYTGGDLSGATKSATFMDVEKDLVEQIKESDRKIGNTFTDSAGVSPANGHVCVCKINHHGSEHSTNGDFLKTMNPSSVVISVGKRYDHPKAVVIKEIEEHTPIKKFFCTSLNKNFTRDISTYDRNNIGVGVSKGVVGGDTVVIVDDSDITTQSKYAVYYNGEKAGTNIADFRDSTSGLWFCDNCHTATVVNYI